MLALTHALSGAALWLVAAPLVAPAASAGQLAVGSAVAAGWALAPDLDHPDATVARRLGPPGQALARLVAAVADGHRGGTHSLLAVALAAAGATAAVQAGPTAAALLTAVSVFVVWRVLVRLAVRAAAGLLLAAAVASALLDGWLSAVALSLLSVSLLAGRSGRRAVASSGSAMVAGLAAGVAGWAVAVGVTPEGGWLVAAVAIGAAAHLAGDLVTGGVPLAWPVRRRVGGRWLTVGGSGETVVLSLLLAASVAAVLGRATGA